MHQYGFKTPIDEFSYRSFLLQMRNFLVSDEHDGRFKERNQVVADQDREVLSVINPTVTPETMSGEFFMPADQAIARYREYFKDWEARGWRIDVAAANRKRKSVAYAIPSPARRAQPKGWILDPIPMLPASRPNVDQLDVDAAG